MELLRTSYMASHTDEQIDRVLEIYCEVGKQLGLISIKEMFRYRLLGRSNHGHEPG